MEKNAKIYVAGHNGLVGSAIVRALKREGYSNIVFRPSKELDLRDQKATDEFFSNEKPEYVFLAAAKVGGIKANMENPVDFIYDNIQIQNNVIHSSWKHNVKKLLFLSSNCVYPKDAPQPYKEESILTGPPEQTNEYYAIAKLSGMKLCQAYNSQHKTNFIIAIPASLFGQNDDFYSENSHLIPALIKKIHNAKENNLKEVVIWGTGTPRREIMYVDDAADACIFLMKNYNSSEPINIGTGKDFAIKDIANTINKIVGFKGLITQDTTKPDGIKKKLLDSSKIFSLGWKPKKEIENALKETYDWYINHL